MVTFYHNETKKSIFFPKKNQKNFSGLCKRKKRSTMREQNAGKRRSKASLLVEGGGARRCLYTPIAPLPNRVTEGVAPRTHSTIDSFPRRTHTHRIEQHGYIRRQHPKSKHRKTATRKASQDRQIGEKCRRNGSDLVATPSVTRVGVGLQWLFGISARHLPLLRVRLTFAHALFPLHGFPFAQME